MKKFTTLMATSAAVLGLAGSLTAINADNVTMSKLQSDNAQLSNTISQLKNNPVTKDVVPYDQFGHEIKGVNDVASNFKPGESRDQLKNDLSDQADCGGETASEAEMYVNTQYDSQKVAYTAASKLYTTADKNTDTVLEDLYALTGDDAAATSSSSKTNTDVKAPAQQATTSNSSKAPAQQATTSNSSKANNDVPAQQATTSNNSKANTDVKAPAQQATTSNNSKANNDVKATAQNTTANGCGSKQ